MSGYYLKALGVIRVLNDCETVEPNTAPAGAKGKGGSFNRRYLNPVQQPNLSPFLWIDKSG
jgi:hypothetical protein